MSAHSAQLSPSYADPRMYTQEDYVGRKVSPASSAYRSPPEGVTYFVQRQSADLLIVGERWLHYP